MIRRPFLALFAGLLFFAAVGQPPQAAPAEDPWLRLDRVAQETVDAGETPGVVFLVGHRGKIVYRKAFGSRSLKPERTPMTVDTVFDLASLTKVIATTSSVMSLVEAGKLRLRDPVSKYWPEFKQNGKEAVTVRQLMTHTSGLPAWENYRKAFGDPNGPAIQDYREQILPKLAATALINPPDTKLVYSDLGFITLGELVRRISGEPLDVYAQRHVFGPLKLHDTGFNPDEARRLRAAPATLWNGTYLQGQVHDPNAAVLGGVAGHAGLFSTADDLARFAKMLLSSDNGDRKHYPLGPVTIREMTSPHTPAGLPVRGLGWDIDSPYAHVRGDLMPLGSFGHTGFTGTYIWVDPYTQSFIIGLSNRVHPDEKGNVLGMWARASNVVCGIVHPPSLPPRPVQLRQPTLTQ